MVTSPFDQRHTLSGRAATAQKPRHFAELGQDRPNHPRTSPRGGGARGRARGRASVAPFPRPIPPAAPASGDRRDAGPPARCRQRQACAALDDQLQAQIVPQRPEAATRQDNATGTTAAAIASDNPDALPPPKKTTPPRPEPPWTDTSCRRRPRSVQQAHEGVSTAQPHLGDRALGFRLPRRQTGGRQTAERSVSAWRHPCRSDFPAHL